jgi:hypothetical protein
MTETTPAYVAEIATIPDAIDLRNLTVIGLMQAHDGPAALLRSARGRIARVQPGSEIFGVKVTAIGDAQVLLTDRSGQTHAAVVAGS